MSKIAPWLSVADAAIAVAFYEAAFGAETVESHADQSGALQVARVMIEGAEVWISRDAESAPSHAAGKEPVHMILTVDDPDAVFARAIAAGATEITAVRDDYGWRIGRLVDPSGHGWEIGKPLG
jgi:PhnB protein